MNDVAIIIPVYCTTEQSLEWLRECVESALTQDCEVVCYDDGSPQDTLSVLEPYELTLIDGGGHVGVSRARNQAVKYARSSLILPLDCDDTLKPGAVEKLLSAWDGQTPVYPDVAKFGDKDIPHYVLLDFDCNHIKTHVGFSSVNVLHARWQHEAIGGWDESLDFYEDGEYNARLFSNWCGKRFPEPLVNYRIHGGQRTETYKSRSREYAKKILAKIRSYDMPCASCGGKRKSRISRATTASAAGGSITIAKKQETDYNTLPGQDGSGRVLTRYVGSKGRGKHYYRGIRTKFPYKVTYWDLVYADPADAREESETTNPSLLVRLHPKPPVPTAARVVKETEPEKPEPERAPVEKAEKEPIIIAKPKARIADPGKMTIEDIKELDLTPETAAEMLALEKKGKARKGALEYLETVANG